TPLTICYCYHLDTAHFLIHTSRIVLIRRMSLRLFFFNDTAPTEIYTLSLHDALPILLEREQLARGIGVTVDERRRDDVGEHPDRSEEHTSELQSPYDLVCRLLLEKKKKKKNKTHLKTTRVLYDRQNVEHSTSITLHIR